MRSGFISIVGRPNVGKSTLLNRILQEKVAIVSDKPQTTRNNIRGILTRGDVQIIFIDTPGIHKPRTKLGEFMIQSAINSMKEAELILFLTDEGWEKGSGDQHILELFSQIPTPKLLAINKIDRIEPEAFLRIYQEYEKTGLFQGIYGISAKEEKNVDRLVERLLSMMPEGPFYFPPDMVTDHPERFIASEIIREKMLLYLDEELPHGVAVEIESFKEEKKLIRIGAVIYCEKKSHKGMIIGKNGKKLKGIGKSARIELEAIFGINIYLELWVKIKENWRDNDVLLSGFGYSSRSE